MNRRHRNKCLRKRNRSRFIRLESLESRIVLDGSAELGIITPNQNAVIEFDGATYLSANDAYDFNSVNAEWYRFSLSESVHNDSSRNLGAIDLASGGSAISQGGDAGAYGDAAIKIGGTVNNSFTSSNAGVIAAAAGAHLSQIELNESGTQFDGDDANLIGDDSVFTDGVSVVKDQTFDDSLEWGFEWKSRPEDTRRLEEIGITGSVMMSNNVVGNDQIRLDDPLVIAPPPTAEGLLPIESPHHPDIGSIARTGSEYAWEAAITSATTQAPEATDAAGSERVAASETGGQRAAASPYVVAISRDRYFAANSGDMPRTPVAWSTQSAASETRQHVTQVSPADRFAVNFNHDRTESGAVHSRVSDTPRDLSDMLLTARMRAAQSTVEMLVSTVSWMATDINPVASTSATNLLPTGWKATTAAGTDVASPVSEGVIRDLLFAKYQPLSVLVGASLVSAHVIADAHASKKKRPARLAPQRIER